MVEARVFRSLLFPKTVAGMPRNFALFLGTMTLAMVVAMGQLWFMLVGVGLAIIASRVTRIDPYFFDLYLTTIKLPEAAY